MSNNAEVDDALISSNELRSLFHNLPNDDRERIKLIFGKGVEQIAEMGNSSFYGPMFRDRQLWIEVMYLIQRFDLLRSILRTCRYQALQQLKNCTCVPSIRKLLLSAFEKLCNEDFEPHQSGSLGDKLLRRSADSNCVKSLEELFRTLGHSELVEETKLYLVTYPNGEVVSEPFKLSNDQFSSCYPMTGHPVGKCVIINIERFEDNAFVNRDGSLCDIENFARAFGAFDFIIEIHKDLKLEQFQSTIQALSKEDHSEYSAFVCCVMSHGEKGTVITHDSKSILIDEIVNTICSCTSLREKPKLFFIQACQGNDVQEALNGHSEPVIASEDGAGSNSSPARSPDVVSNAQDVLRSYATIEGCRAFRDERKGSYYVTALTQALNDCDDYADILSILCKVNDIVGSIPITYKNGECSVNRAISQTAICQSTLRKPVRFYRNPNQ